MHICRVIGNDNCSVFRNILNRIVLRGVDAKKGRISEALHQRQLRTILLIKIIHPRQMIKKQAINFVCHQRFCRKVISIEDHHFHFISFVCHQFLYNLYRLFIQRHASDAYFSFFFTLRVGILFLSATCKSDERK